MLPPFIIEQIRRREEEKCRREQQDQPRLELPLDVYRPIEPKREEREPAERGVVILDLC
jgi:hypothetical protein